MADLFVCRVTYKKTISANVYGNGSSIYAFKTTSFSNAESLAYTKAKAETSYYTDAKVTSIKRKNISSFDDLTVTTDKPYLYRASVTNLKSTSEEDTYICASFVFPSSANPSNYDAVQLKADLEEHLEDTGYALSDSGTKISSVKYSYELGKKKLASK